jgi:hypothetical protein
MTSARHIHEQVSQSARHMSDDEWQAHTTREAAKAIGQWLEARGRLHLPIRSLTMPELEAMASNAIDRWVVLNSHRIKERPEASEHLMWLLAG